MPGCDKEDIFDIKKIDIHWDFWGKNNLLDAIEIVFKSILFVKKIADFGSNFHYSTSLISNIILLDLNFN